MNNDFTWPQGHTAAAAFTFDVDAESCVLAHDPTSADCMSLMSHQSYGPRVGVPRILRILERQDVRATFFVPGFTAECYPDTVRAIIDGGHEVGHHGCLHEPMKGLDPATEARYLDRGLDTLEEVAGIRPVGYRAPWWEMNWHTPELLVDRGFLYDSSLLDGDKPYLMATSPASERTLIEIPVDWALDDWEQYAFYPGVTGSGVIESPAKVLEMWTLEAEAHHAEGGCFALQGSRIGTTHRERQSDGRDVGDHPRGHRGTRPARLHRTLRTHPIRNPHLPRRPAPADFPGPRNCSFRTVRDPQSSTVTPYSVASVARSYSYPCPTARRRHCPARR
ncbi:hydrolase [Rhodococcus wratislaviensis IFP 2016]|nr:hydrolase [Rhodococcus wratislaviensis IFP 2016]CAG7583107.1 hypothetical protein E143388_01223 [Rhodococcus opacus]